MVTFFDICVIITNALLLKENYHERFRKFKKSMYQRGDSPGY